MNNYVDTIAIEKYMNENKLSKTKFCKTCKISISTFNRIIAGKNIKLIALFRIAKIMNINICKLFKQ